MTASVRKGNKRNIVEDRIKHWTFQWTLDITMHMDIGHYNEHWTMQWSLDIKPDNGHYNGH